MKKLIPSHREKKRYLLIIGKNANKEDIEKSILEFIGVLGYSESGIEFIKKENEKIILSVNRKSVDKIRSSFLLSGNEIEIKKISGSIKKLKF